MSVVPAYRQAGFELFAAFTHNIREVANSEIDCSTTSLGRKMTSKQDSLEVLINN